MADICNSCGLPQELCVCNDIESSESPDVTVEVEERSYDKKMTIVEGIASGHVDELNTELKSCVAAGGTQNVDDGIIEIQGDHAGNERFIETIENMGYTVES